MEEIQATWEHAAKIWWSWVWRAVLWAIPASAAFGFVAGFIMALTGIPIEPNKVYIQIIGGLIGVYFAIFAMKIILTKQFKGYRLALVKTDKANEVSIDV